MRHNSEAIFFSVFCNLFFPKVILASGKFGLHSFFMSQALGIKIREARRRAGLTQSDVASSLNVTSAAVGQWERGLTSPGIRRLPLLCDLLNLDVEDLIPVEHWAEARIREEQRRKNLNEARILKDGSSQNLGATVGASRVAIQIIADLLIEAGLAKPEYFANRAYARAKQSRKDGYNIQSDVLSNSFGEYFESQPIKDEFKGADSPDHVDVFLELNNRIKALEVDLRAAQLGFMMVANLSIDRSRLREGLRAEAAKLARQQDLPAERAIQKLMKAI